MSTQSTATLSPHVREEIDHWVQKFPQGRQKSAVISALHAVQHENHGHVTKADIEAVADYLDLEPIEVWEVATFYSIFEIEPVGKICVSVCTNVSCWLRGSAEIVDHIETRYGIKTGESTADGKIYLKREEECLAACNNAPMMMIDHVYHENLTPKKVDEILDAVEKQ